MADRTQWVNLWAEKSSEYVDGKAITKADQISSVIAPRLSFKHALPGSAKVRVVPDGPAPPYSDAERDRWMGFALWIGLKTVKPDGPKDIDASLIALPQAGDYRWKLEAIDPVGNKVTSKTIIVTRRRIDYHVVAMQGIFARPDGKPGSGTGLKDMDTIIEDVVAAMKKDHLAIEMVHVGRDGAVAPMTVYEMRDDKEKVLGNTYKPFLELVNKTFKPVDRRVSVAIAWVPWLPVKKRTVLKFSGTFDEWAGNAGSIRWDFDEREKRLNIWVGDKGGPHIWHGFSKDEDKAGKFLEGLVITLGHPPNGLIIQRNASHARIEGPPETEWGGHVAFSVDLKDVWQTLEHHRHRPLKVSAGLFMVSGWLGGLSFNGTSVIAVADRAWWKVKSPNGKYSVLLHELGHRFGLSANGNDTTSKWRQPNTPDKSGDYYDDTMSGTPQSHRGNHCKAGIASFSAPEARWTPSCVMFGQTFGSAKTPFCPACKEDLRLADLSGAKPKPGA
jgi:hypothetical protein